MLSREEAIDKMRKLRTNNVIVVLRDTNETDGELESRVHANDAQIAHAKDGVYIVTYDVHVDSTFSDTDLEACRKMKRILDEYEPGVTIESVVGYRYGYDADGRITDFKIGKVYPVLYVCDQHGWRAPADTNFRLLMGAECISGAPGDPCSLGAYRFKCTKVIPISRENIPAPYTPKAPVSEETDGEFLV